MLPRACSALLLCDSHFALHTMSPMQDHDHHNHHHHEHQHEHEHGEEDCAQCAAGDKDHAHHKHKHQHDTRVSSVGIECEGELARVVLSWRRQS